MDNTTKLRSDYFFECSFPVGSEDYDNIIQVVNQGIDARLTGFTRSEFRFQEKEIGRFKLGRLFCWIHYLELEVLIRRLLELKTEQAEMLADDIVMVEYGVETI